MTTGLLHTVPSIDKSFAILDDAWNSHPCKMVLLCFSGGHDSLTASHIGALWAKSRGLPFVAFHANTGIGVPQTRVFVREVCAELDWPLWEYKATDHRNAKGEPDPQLYESLVERFGFPGPNHHRVYYSRLKERAIERLYREHNFGKSAMALLVSGVRKQESVRRSGQRSICEVDRNRVWVSPIYDWTKTHTTIYLRTRRLRRNPVVDKIHKSGECLCGAFAKKGEFEELSRHYPEVAARIRQLERQVWDKFPWGWEEERPPSWFRQQRDGQSMLFEMEPDKPNEFMCTDCIDDSL